MQMSSSQANRPKRRKYVITGALLLLSVPICKGQKLLLTNQLTQQEQDCRVVFLGTRYSRTVEAGVAFPATNPAFWQLHSPPEGKPAA